MMHRECIQKGTMRLVESRDFDINFKWTGTAAVVQRCTNTRNDNMQLGTDLTPKVF